MWDYMSCVNQVAHVSSPSQVEPTDTPKVQPLFCKEQKTNSFILGNNIFKLEAVKDHEA